MYEALLQYFWLIKLIIHSSGCILYIKFWARYYLDSEVSVHFEVWVMFEGGEDTYLKSVEGSLP